MKTPFSFFFVAVLMILASLSACKKENSATHSSSPKAQTATPSEQKQQAPIAYVEVDSLLTQYKFCTENKSVLEAKSKQYQSQVAAKMAQVQKAYADFQQKMQNGTFTTREQAEAAQLRIQRMQQEGAKLEEQLQKRMTAEQEKFNNTLRDSLQSFLKDYNKDMGYSMIVSKQGDNVLYADPSLNLTKAVIEGMNKRYKSTKK